MAKVIKVQDDTMIKLYRLVTKKRIELAKQGELTNVSYDDIINEAISTKPGANSPTKEE
jgi:hypothetical protein